MNRFLQSLGIELEEGQSIREYLVQRRNSAVASNSSNQDSSSSPVRNEASKKESREMAGEDHEARSNEEPGKVHSTGTSDGDGNRTVVVSVPPNRSRADALVYAVMAVLNISRPEAEKAIAEEEIHFVHYSPLGLGQDERGYILHRIRIRPGFWERTEHEPVRPGQKPDEKVDQYYRLFRSHVEHLEESTWHNEDGALIADQPLEIIFDAWALQNGFYPMGGNINALVNGLVPGLLALEMLQYEKLKEKVVTLVLFDRLRKRREGLSEEAPGDIPSVVVYLRDLESRLWTQLPENIRYGTGDNPYLDLFQEFYSLRIRLAPHATSILNGDPEASIPDALAFELAEFSKALHDRANRLPNSTFGQNSAFTRMDAFVLQRLAESGESRSMADNQNLLAATYQMTFALFELMGTNGSKEKLEWAEFQALPEARKEELLREHHTAQTGKRGRRTLELMSQRPHAIPITATFYPEAATNKMRLNDQEAGKENAVQIELFLYFDAGTSEWVLDDLSDVDDKKQNRVKGIATEPVPAELFDELDTRLRLPKGALMYRVPGESTFRIMEVTGDLEWYEWLRYASLMGIGVSLAFATGGMSVAATLLILGSTTGFAVADLGEMLHKGDVGVLDTLDVVYHVSSIVASLSAGMGAFSRLALSTEMIAQSPKAAQIVQQAQKGFYFLELSGDATGLGIMSLEAVETLMEMQERGASEAEFAQVLSFYAGMGVVFGIGMRGTMRDIGNGPQSLKNAREVANADHSATPLRPGEVENSETGYGKNREPEESPAKKGSEPENMKNTESDQIQDALTGTGLSSSEKRLLRKLFGSIQRQDELARELSEAWEGLRELRGEVWGERVPGFRQLAGQASDITHVIAELGRVVLRDLSKVVRRFMEDPQKMLKLVSAEFRVKIREGKITAEIIYQALLKTAVGRRLKNRSDLKQVVKQLFDDQQMKDFTPEEKLFVSDYFAVNPQAEVTPREVVEAYRKHMDPKTKSLTIEAPPQNLKRGGNKELNQHLLPYTEYQVDGYTYKTDQYGRVNEASGELFYAPDTLRSPYQQRKAVVLKDGKKGDDGGHIFAAMFRGAKEQINYWPMADLLNRKKWLEMEKMIRAKLKEGAKVEANLTAIFEGTSKRPGRFEVKITVTTNGEKQSPKLYKFDN